MESIQGKIAVDEDMADVIALMVNLNIETKGCKNFEQMQDRICEHLKVRQDHLDPKKVSSTRAEYIKVIAWISLLSFFGDLFSSLNRVISDVLWRITETF